MKLDIRESDFNINERNYTRKVNVYVDDGGFLLLLKLEESLLAKNHLDTATLSLFKMLSSGKELSGDVE